MQRRVTITLLNEDDQYSDVVVQAHGQMAVVKRYESIEAAFRAVELKPAPAPARDPVPGEYPPNTVVSADDEIPY